MYEELYEKLDGTAAYFERLGLEPGSVRPDLEGLDRVLPAQLNHIPFDDMDVWGKGACPDLGIKALYEKIVLRRRGGYCFELNSLFNALLRALGFNTYMVIAHIIADRGGLTPPGHCAVICSIDGEKYFCDVGYGGLVPEGGVPFSGESRYGFHIEKGENYTELINEKEGRVEMCFRDAAVNPIEFIPLNFHMSQSNTSLFRNSLLLNLRMEGGSVSLTDLELKYRRGEERWERSIGEEEIPAVMEEYFGIPSGGVYLRNIGPWGDN